MVVHFLGAFVSWWKLANCCYENPLMRKLAYISTIYVHVESFLDGAFIVKQCGIGPHSREME